MANRISRHKVFPGAVEGVVISTDDPQQQGRVQVWCPALDGPNVNEEALPWATVTSPFAGQVLDYPAGSTGTVTKGLMSYGFWAIPKINSIVDVILLYNDPNQRRVMGSSFGNHGNRSIPVGRNRPDIGAEAPVSDTLEPVEPQTSNLKVQFQGKLSAPEARTRGAYERQAAQDKDVRDGSEGYQKTPFAEENYLDAQTYALTTPGRHSLIFQDHPTTGRVRIKTADGHQIILDDANERIYISTCHGKSWIEMDRDGHIHMYGSASVSVSAGKDLNLTAGGSLNISGKNVNIVSSGNILASACGQAALSGASTFIESSGALNIKAGGTLIQSGSNIHLNGPAAASAPCATAPTIIPNHEPWTRPPAALARGKKWKA